MTLQDKLNNLKANFEKSAPKEALEIMHRATGDLSNSGIMDGVVKTGDTAPEFELKDNDEKVIRLKDFLGKGPVVLSFYRGKW
jgi:AhpC/TSA family